MTTPTDAERKRAKAIGDRHWHPDDNADWMVIEESIAQALAETRAEVEKRVAELEQELTNRKRDIERHINTLAETKKRATALAEADKALARIALLAVSHKILTENQDVPADSLAVAGFKDAIRIAKEWRAARFAD